MSIPQEFINELNERADLVELVGRQVKLERRGSNFVGLCPFHTEKTPSFTVSPEKGFYHCFGCGANGNALGFIQQHYAADFLTAVEKLAMMQGMEVPQQAGSSENNTKRQQITSLLAEAMQYFEQQLRLHEGAKEYLKSRQLTGKTASLYKVGYAPKEWDGLKKALSDKEALLADAGLVRIKDKDSYDYFRDRIIFPIIDTNERVCGFGGRAMDDENPPKYLNSSENDYFSKRRLLFGLPQAMKAAQQKKRLIICEGYMDVLMLAQAGFSEAVATMGTAATAEQMKKAIRFAPNIYFAYDGDVAGQKGAFRAMQGVLPALKDGISVHFLFLPQGHDPDSYLRANGSDAFEQLLTNAQSLGDYLAETLWQQADATSSEGRATSVLKEGEQLLRLIDNSDAPAWRSVLEKRIEQRAGGVSMEQIKKAQSAKLKRAPRAQPKTVFRMQPQSLLYNLLCCLTAKPSLAETLPLTLPLPGAMQDVEVVNIVLSRLRWHMPDEDNEEESKLDVIATVEENGYPQLAQQLRDSVTGRHSRALDIEAELKVVVTELEQLHHKLSGKSKSDNLKKIQQMLAE